MNPFFIPIYQLYLLQLENYELGRYWKLLFQKGYLFSSQPLRKTIVWTKKAILLFGGAILLYCGGIIVVSSVFPGIFPALFGVFGFLLFPVWYTVALLCVLPLDVVIKNIYIGRAKHVLASRNVKIIGIAGSYGKTTMKNVVSSVLSKQFQVITTPESVNTPIGIAQWLTHAMREETEIVIVEMGEHYQGDIEYLCSITPPDIAILTGINEAHLERLETLDTSVATMFEIVMYAKKDATIILNADDANSVKNHQTYTEGKRISWYSANNHLLGQMNIAKKIFHEESLRWEYTIPLLGSVSVALLGSYGAGDIVAALMIGKLLGMDAQKLKQGIENISPVSHRLEPLKGASGALIIDDSYNGNPDGVREAIHVLSLFKKRRKIYITPGLVETGKEKETIHTEIGRLLAGVADRVILIKNSVTPYIEQGLKEKKFDESHIIWFNTASAAHAALSTIVEPNDVILFQNDWGDQYV